MRNFIIYLTPSLKLSESTDSAPRRRKRKCLTDFKSLSHILADIFMLVQQ